MPPYDRDVNTVFQDYALFPHMSVQQNVEYGLKVKGVGKGERRRRAGEMLEPVRLGGYGNRKPTPAERRSAPACRPRPGAGQPSRVLLLDEPLGALDLKLREEMQVELKRIQHEVGITFVFVTHDQGEALSMSTRIAVFNHGRIEQVGTPRQIYDHPTTDVRRRLRRHVEPARRRSSRNGCSASAAPHILRPERIVLADGGAGWQRDVTVAGTVADIQYLGPESKVHVDLDDGTRILASVASDGARLAWRRRSRGRAPAASPGRATRRLTTVDDIHSKGRHEANHEQPRHCWCRSHSSPPAAATTTTRPARRPPPRTRRRRPPTPRPRHRAGGDVGAGRDLLRRRRRRRPRHRPGRDRPPTVRIDYMWTPNPDVLAGAEGQVNIVAWAGYIEDGTNDPDADWVTPFEEMTECAVNVKLGDTSDEMVQLMQSGEYDGVSASGDATNRLMAGGEVEPLDVSEFTSYDRDLRRPQGQAVELARRCSRWACPTVAAPTWCSSTPRRSPTGSTAGAPMFEPGSAGRGRGLGVRQPDLHRRRGACG